MSFRELSNEHVRGQLGERVRALRKSRRLTQAQLAERAGLSRPTVSTLERGNDVSLDSFLSILRAIGLLDALDAAVTVPEVSPMEELVGTSRSARSATQAKASDWSWGDEREEPS